MAEVGMLTEDLPSGDVPSGELPSEEEESEYDESEEVEPSLKYARSVKGELTSGIFENTQASSIAVHEKFIVIGDIKGQVFLLDHSGNIIRHINAHKGAVTCLSIDPEGEFIASASSHDTTVVIKGLYSIEKDTSESYGRSVHSVELGPDFVNNNQYAVGTDRLLFNEKGFFGLKRNVIHAGEGPVWTIKWKNNFIAWANDMGVKIYDTISKKQITKIGRDPKSPSPADYLCHLCWYSTTTLLVGWANTIKICEVRLRTNINSPDLPPYFVEVLNIIYLDHYVAGIGPQIDNRIISLGYCPPVDGQPVRPCVRIINFEGVELTLEELSIKGFEHCHANSYKMTVLEADHFVYFMAPTDLVTGKPRDLDDKVEWLVSKQKFEQALQVVNENAKKLHQFTHKEVGQKYLAYLRQIGQYEKCSELCSNILKQDKKWWEEEVFAFHQCQKLTVLCPRIPTKSPELESWSYELALCSFLKAHDFDGFDQFVKLWPSRIYKQEPVIKYLIKILKEIKLEVADNVKLVKCLGLLYEYQEDFVNALYLYIKLQDAKAFDLIDRHNLFSSLAGDLKILRLMKLNEDRAISLYINNTDKIPVPAVHEGLKKNRYLLYKYLDSLFVADPELGFEYHKDTEFKERVSRDMIELYAEFDTDIAKSKLMRFLKESVSYPIDKAYEVCEKRKFYQAQVYLLTRMGHSVQALSLLIDEIGDITKAIDFCKEQEDAELWDSLLKKATESNKPKFITGLLQNIGTHINPKDLIARIPDGQKIEGLRDSLVKILCDYKLQINLSDGCKKVFVNDTVNLSKKMRALGKRGIHVDEGSNCQICKCQIVTEHDNSDVLVYFCGHGFHDTCLTKNYCISCFK